MQSNNKSVGSMAGNFRELLSMLTSVVLAAKDKNHKVEEIITILNYHIIIKKLKTLLVTTFSSRKLIFTNNTCYHPLSKVDVNNYLLVEGNDDILGRKHKNS